VKEITLAFFSYLFVGGLQLFTEVIPNQCFICFKNDLTSSDRIAMEDKYQLIHLKDFLLTRARLYQTPAGTDLTQLLSSLEREPTVLYASLNHYHRALSTAISEPRFKEQWYLDNLGTTYNYREAKVGADIRWKAAIERYKPRQERVVVSVIDTGISADHPELKDRRAYMPAEVNGTQGVDDDGLGYVDDTHGWDFIGNDNDPSDLNGHGTQVAGLIASHSLNRMGTTGIAPNSVILPMRVFNEYGGGATDDRVISALGYSIAGGVRIINLSLGRGSPFSFPIQDALFNLEESFDVLLICAAGNGGSDAIGDDLDLAPVYPASYEGKTVLSVAATDENDELAKFSNFGKITVDLAAPGVNVLTPDLSRKTISFEDFEGELAGWSFSNPGNEARWERLTDQFGNRWLTDSAYNADGFFADYGYNLNFSLISPIFDLNASKGSSLKIRIYHDLARSFFFLSYDTLWIEASSTDSDQWTTVGQIYGRSQRGGSLYQFDLSSFDGQRIRLRFRLETDDFRNADGVYLDDLEISGVSSFEKGSEQYAFVSGTSFAAPMVSGVAAMLLAHRPEISSQQVREILLATVRPVEALSGKVASGGIVNAEKAIIEAQKAKIFLDRGWHFHDGDWVYSESEQSWNLLLRNGLQISRWGEESSTSSWSRLDPNELSGWKYHSWPYGFDNQNQTWEYYQVDGEWIAWRNKNRKWHVFDYPTQTWKWVADH